MFIYNLKMFYVLKKSLLLKAFIKKSLILWNIIAILSFRF